MEESIPHRLTCAQAIALLIDYIAGDLDASTAQVMAEHLASCVDCVAFLRTYQETIRVTRTVRYEELPSELQHRLLQTLHSKMTGAPPP